MKLTISEPNILKESVSVISELVTEARIKVTPEALEIVAMDPANVAMVVFKLLSSAFTEYDVKENVEIAINLGNLKQILRRANQNDVLTLEATPENKLKIDLKGNTNRTFSLSLIELEEKEQKIPQLKFGANISLDSDMLNQAIEDANIVAESVVFIAEPEKFSIKADGDLSQAKIEMKKGENTKISIDGKRFKSKYSIEYLKKMINASKLADTVNIYFSEDYPLKLEYKVVDKLSLGFILAPRTDEGI